MKLIALAFVLLAAPVFAQEPVFVPAGKAPFSLSAQVGDVLYLSGQIGNDKDGKLADGMEAQARQTMDNIAASLARSGASMRDVFKCTVMLADMSKWQDFNKVYVTYFDSQRLPARSAMGVNGLVGGALMEVECWAYRPQAARK